jgi:hypothetical protein
MKWQPIETAPAGITVLVFDKRQKFEDAICTATQYGLENNRYWARKFGKARMKPSHWMPLPSPPR